jgi:hypothetical protein
MNGRNAALLECLFQPEIEVRRVNADEHIGRISQQAAFEVRADGGDLAIVPEHLDVAAHRQLLERMPGVEAQPEHLRTADAENTAFGSLPCSAWMSWLASRSPDASPATMAIRTTPRSSDDAALRDREEVEQRLDFGMCDGIFASLARASSSIRPDL